MSSLVTRSTTEAMDDDHNVFITYMPQILITIVYLTMKTYIVASEADSIMCSDICGPHYA
jgi:hypothetical protein